MIEERRIQNARTRHLCLVVRAMMMSKTYERICAPVKTKAQANALVREILGPGVDGFRSDETNLSLTYVPTDSSVRFVIYDREVRGPQFDMTWLIEDVATPQMK